MSLYYYLILNININFNTTLMFVKQEPADN